MHPDGLVRGCTRRTSITERRWSAGFCGTGQYAAAPFRLGLGPGAREGVQVRVLSRAPHLMTVAAGSMRSVVGSPPATCWSLRPQRNVAGARARTYVDEVGMYAPCSRYMGDAWHRSRPRRGRGRVLTTGERCGTEPDPGRRDPQVSSRCRSYACRTGGLVRIVVRGRCGFHCRRGQV
jgi:hypothetical protein